MKGLMKQRKTHTVKLLLALLIALIAGTAQAQTSQTLVPLEGARGTFFNTITSWLDWNNRVTVGGGVSGTAVCPAWANVIVFRAPSPTTAAVQAKANGIGSPSTGNTVSDGTDWQPLPIGLALHPSGGYSVNNVALWSDTANTQIKYSCSK